MFAILLTKIQVIRVAGFGITKDLNWFLLIIPGLLASGRDLGTKGGADTQGGDFLPKRKGPLFL